MTRLLGEVFTRGDPPAVAVGLTPLEFEAMVRLYCSKAAAEGLTIVARRAGSHEFVGALLAEDSDSEAPEGVESLSSKFDPIFEMLAQLETEYRAARAAHVRSVHLFLLGVTESAAGQGVAQHLVSACLEHAARRGFQLAVTEATNPISQHVFRKLGFAERVWRSYEDFRFNGQAVFASIAAQGGPILMDKALLG